MDLPGRTRPNVVVLLGTWDAWDAEVSDPVVPGIELGTSAYEACVLALSPSFFPTI